MRVLLKERADAASAETILVLPQRDGTTLETLAGDAAPKGIVAEADPRTVTDALNAGARARNDEFVTAKDLQRDVKWLSKVLGEYELGSKISLKPSSRSYPLDDSEATRINRAEGLAKDDMVAIGPTISPRVLMNARGRIVSIEGDKVEVELEASDRDRIQRATGKDVAECGTFPLNCVEKVV